VCCAAGAVTRLCTGLWCKTLLHGHRMQVELLLWDGPRGGQTEVLPMAEGECGQWSIQVLHLFCDLPLTLGHEGKTPCKPDSAVPAGPYGLAGPVLQVPAEGVLALVARAGDAGGHGPLRAQPGR
jgi:hypothetical protein